MLASYSYSLVAILIMEGTKRSLLVCFILIVACSSAASESSAKYGTFQFNKDGEVDWSSDLNAELFLWEGSSSSGEKLPHLFWSNGDMRLASSTSYPDTPSAGRLEIYTKSMYCLGDEHDDLHSIGSGDESEGKWGTVCGQGFTMKEAHVACRQLGYQGAQKWNYTIYTEFGMANESTPIALTDVNCHASTLLHLMRCNFNEPDNSDAQQQSGCDHTKDVVVYCDTARIWDEPYGGQVRLVSDELITGSYGRVEIFQGHEWGTVCKENFNEAAANSVCRQLGYTGAVGVSDAQPGSGVVWVNEVSCESSQPCFTSCFKHHKWTHDCNHTQDVAIQCAYDVNRASKMTSGSRAQCRIKLFPLAVVILCTTLSLTAILVIGCGLVVFIVVTRCCRRKCAPKKLRYEQLS